MSKKILIIEDEKTLARALELKLTRAGFEPTSAGSTERFFNFLDGKASVLLINRLPETYRKVMYMRYVQELSIKEMSLITGQSKNSITVQAHRGLEKLKELYKSAQLNKGINLIKDKNY
jgi:DNA-directed RNA polymerase specialized sigma24 family protein